MVKKGFRLSMEKKILRDTNHDCWWFCFPPDTDNGISGHAWKSQKGEFLRRWKPFTKPAPLYHFFPVPPAGKGWKYYPRLLHRLPEELEALLCLGTCPKPWSTHLTKQPGFEQLWNVPQLPVPHHFLSHSSEEETGTGVTGRSHPAHPVWHVQALNWECAEGLWYHGPVSAA